VTFGRASISPIRPMISNLAKLIMHPPFVTSFGEEAYRGRPTSRIPPGRGLKVASSAAPISFSK
jgi:hypothetical protein